MHGGSRRRRQMMAERQGYQTAGVLSALTKPATKVVRGLGPKAAGALGAGIGAVGEGFTGILSSTPIAPSNNSGSPGSGLAGVLSGTLSKVLVLGVGAVLAGGLAWVLV